MDFNNHYEESNILRKLRNIPRRNKRRRRKKLVLAARCAFGSFLSLVFIVLCLGLGSYKGIIASAPKISEINIGPGKYATFVYDTEGRQIQQINEAQSNRVRVSIEDIPEYMQHAIVAIEDSRFYEHNGVDPRGMARAVMTTVISGFQKTEGASTITQQLIKNNIFTDWTDENFLQSVERKIQEQYLAVELEQYLTDQGLDAKSVILEEYLNTVNFGSGAYGIQKAAQTYFGKDCKDLTLSECAVLAAIPQNPTKWNPRQNPKENAKRRETVLNYMRKQEWISQEELEAALEDNVYDRILDESNDQSQVNVYSYFVDELIDQVQEDLVEEKGYTESQAVNMIYNGGLRIYSTQDTQIQEIMESEFENEANYPEDVCFELDWTLTVEQADGNRVEYDQETLADYFKEKDSSFSGIYESQEQARRCIVEYKASVVKGGDKIVDERINYVAQPQAAMTVIEQSTGYVRGIVGGLGEKTASLVLNRAADTYRQPGSVFKILSAYGPALNDGKITLATHIQDEAYTYEDGTPLRNADNRYHGSVSVRQAIRNSYNIPAVKVLTDITPGKGFEYLQKLGFSSLIKEADVTQALALGGITHGVSNLELTAAYAAVANGGTYIEPAMYTEVTDQEGNVILKNEVKGRNVFKESTAYLLTSAMEDVVSEGTGTGFQLQNMHVAGKTGTANDYRDLTFAGYTPYYTAAIWAGYDDSKELPESQRTFHRTLWKNVMNRIHEFLPDKEFEQPSAVTKKAVCANSGLLAGTGCIPVYEYFDEDNTPTETCTAHRPIQKPKTNQGNNNKNSTKKKAYANWWEYYWDQIWKNNSR